MSNPGEADLTPITSARQMAEWFAAGCKPRDAWGVGTEHEKFGFHRDGFATPGYEGPGGIRAILDGLRAEGWAPILDAGSRPGSWSCRAPSCPTCMRPIGSCRTTCGKCMR